tara:strand:- start:138 stop:1223 length:1086 start_codon:yes stop_codon:yes gene_type:complete
MSGIVDKIIMPGGVDTACVTPDGKYLLTLASNKFIKWSLEKGTRVCTVVEKDYMRSMCVTPDGMYVVTGSRDNKARMWNVQTPSDTTQAMFAPQPHIDGHRLVRTFEGHSGTVTSVCVTPDGNYLVTGSSDKTSRVWNLHNGELVRTLRGRRSGEVVTVCLTPDGKRVVTTSLGLVTNTDTARVWKLDSGELLGVFDLGCHTDSTCVTPDGMYLVVGSWGDDSAHMFRLCDGAHVRTFHGHSLMVTSVCVTPDGKHLVTGSFDDTGRVWNLGSGQCVRTLGGHFCSVTSCVTPDGKHVVTASGDIARVWPLAKARWGQLRGKFWGEKLLRWWHSVVWMPGSRLAIATACEFYARAKRVKVE